MFRRRREDSFRSRTSSVQLLKAEIAGDMTVAQRISQESSSSGKLGDSQLCTSVTTNHVSVKSRPGLSAKSPVSYGDEESNAFSHDEDVRGSGKRQWLLYSLLYEKRQVYFRIIRRCIAWFGWTQRTRAEINWRSHARPLQLRRRNFAIRSVKEFEGGVYKFNYQIIVVSPDKTGQEIRFVNSYIWNKARISNREWSLEACELLVRLYVRVLWIRWSPMSKGCVQSVQWVAILFYTRFAFWLFPTA